MSIDIVKALDAGTVESAVVRSSASPRGEFPHILQSNLDGVNDTDRGASAVATTNAEVVSQGEEESGHSQVPDDESGLGGESASSKGAENQDAGSASRDGGESDAATDAATLGAATAALASAQRIGTVVESDIEIGGRLSELTPGVRQDGLLEEGRRISDAEVNALEAQLDGAADELAKEETLAKGGGEGGDATGRLNPAAEFVAEVGAVQGGLTEGGQEIARELPAVPDAESTQAANGTDSGTEQQRHDEANAGNPQQFTQTNEQALFDRAGDGAQSGEVDPNLRQALANSDVAQRAPESVSIEGAGVIANPIAGAVTETTTTAAPGVPSPAVASDAIAVQTEWLATRGGGTARLILSPPSLGEIAIQVTLRGGSVDVVMIAQEAMAQAVAEDQADRLAQAFSSRDLRLDNFEVRRGDAQDLNDGDLEFFSQSETKGEGRTDQDRRSERGAQRRDSQSIAMNEVKNQMVQPEILSVGPDAGVDLRI